MTMVLALDSSTAACSVAVWHDGVIVAHCFEVLDRSHAERLIPMVDDAIKSSGHKFEEIDLVAVTVGPGAFTGLRIGISTARGLALALNIPCVGISSMECLCACIDGARDGDVILTVLDTKRGDLFVQIFDFSSKALCNVAIIPSDGVINFIEGIAKKTRCIVAGDALEPIQEALTTQGLVLVSSGTKFPDATQVANIAAWRLEAGRAQLPPKPVYLRLPDASIPLNVDGLRA
ncbi:MAG: tRNA (adenosine(37)-N6)-threonylcarbamoyltransferase complex dimerization subunit type 1 TsaB [Rhodospirillaceae bacterium TMED8]|nr:tRNA (adenosine(37)-N6)-threonylcarbamoyltransferase complex dimerization subunit type 1 TsaB [Magnetovibrio sp.]OUT50429.1 MAG: tRNA (adenosine(37)-N6)-threonylcarbamoyltransferase complex dimerization subunit type 1 TsaB [Rhodospirillaceae bacterium TMED8]